MGFDSDVLPDSSVVVGGEEEESVVVGGGDEEAGAEEEVGGAALEGGVQSGEKAPVAEPGFKKKRLSDSKASNLTRHADGSVQSIDTEREIERERGRELLTYEFHPRLKRLHPFSSP